MTAHGSRPASPPPGELCVCDIAALVGVSVSAVSHQLRLLRGMRLVRPRRSGRQVFYSLDDQHILHLLRLAVTHVQEDAMGAVQPVAGPAVNVFLPRDNNDQEFFVARAKLNFKFGTY